MIILAWSIWALVAVDPWTMQPKVYDRAYAEKSNDRAYRCIVPQDGKWVHTVCK